MTCLMWTASSLTAPVVVYGDGSESKRFPIRDGIALVWAQRAGIKVGLLSARHSPTTAQRAAQLGITLIHQGVSSKAAAYDQIVGDMVVDRRPGRLHG